MWPRHMHARECVHDRHPPAPREQAQKQVLIWDAISASVWLPLHNIVCSHMDQSMQNQCDVTMHTSLGVAVQR